MSNNIDITFKGLDTRQGVTHANGTIGGYWTFAHGGMKEVILKVKCLYYWFASYSDGWKVTIPAGCPSDNGIEIMAMVQERLTEVYGEG
jgi:hypothetical protein